MVDVKTDIVINCPLNITASYASNPENAPEWYVNIDSAEWVQGRQVELGAKIAFKAKFLGKELAYIYEIVQFEPGKLLVMRTANGPFPMETTYMWEAVTGSSTRMTLRNRGNPSGFSMFAAPLMSFMMRRANLKDLRMIKKILENRQ